MLDPEKVEIRPCPPSDAFEIRSSSRSVPVPACVRVPALAPVQNLSKIRPTGPKIIQN